MRTRRSHAALLALLALALAPGPALGQGASEGGPADPLLARLVEESLAARPELRQAEAAERAERERVPQAGALPDPVLSLGIQNDGFERIQIGEMESSYYQVMLSQGLPWPGKRGLRTDVARLAAGQAEAAVARARLSTEADVRRAYLDLLVARDRLSLLARLEALWQKSAGVARARYEAGEGAQSDVLRAQLELNRLRQRRWSLEAEARVGVQTLNRLRARPLDEPIPTTASVRSQGLPPVPDAEAALADALARSPELALARLGASRAEKQVALARRERFPDLSVNAGVMPRGDLEPMWQAGVSIGLPIWSGRKQSRAVAESEARAAGDQLAADAVEQILRLRVAERRLALQALAETVRLYREGLLVQSQATADSTLAQYRVGKVTFASVLDANAGLVGDEEGYLLALADAQRIAIASAEVTLEPVGIAGAGGAMGGASIPGAGGAGGARAGSSAAAGAPAAAASSSSMPSGM
ncbi:MAG TPA: TolC family protein [Anaeromyxobacteraceae bacterium]|nr:TolC family protein [Anaeromyxobacteraceae bacterium]